MNRSFGSLVIAGAVVLTATGCPPEEEGAPEVTGTFAVTSTIDIRVANVLPTTIYDKLETLRALRDDPGNLFFDLVEEAGLPLVAELRAMLPDAVEDQVGDWITDAIPESVRAQIDAILAATDITLGEFDLLSELTLPAADSGGRARATHRLSSLRFVVEGRSFELAIPASSAAPFVTITEVEAVIGRGGENGADARLTLAEHSFGLHYGEFAYQLIEAHVQAKFGVDLRTHLGDLVDCEAVAAEVAAKCILNVCVGHAEQLEELCNKGLDKAVEKLHEKLAEERFDAVVFSSGEADLWDDVGDDGVLDLVDGGVWQASINLGQGLRPAPATFVGSRQ
jgi:hypothetical protein